MDTWKGRENLGNAKEVLREFEKEYRRDEEEIRWQEREEDKGIYHRRELPGRYMAKKLYCRGSLWATCIILRNVP